ncbi:MAG TPA: zf-HC2 domain-containing protein [Acidobacteriota bacterium]|nr:zf-HC2 domain-containing protein [Acidobacteriota bacterium]
MNCKEIRGHIEDFHYGELDEGAAAQVRTHLRTCPECARALEVLSAEDTAYQAYSEELDRSLEISPSVWQKVQEGIASPAAKRSSRPLSAPLAEFLGRVFPFSPVLRQAVFAAMLVLLSVGATLLTVHYYRVKETGLIDGQTAGTSDRLRRTGTQNSLEAALLSIQRAERDYQDAIEMLSRIVDKRKPSLDPQLLAEVEKNLRSIDESIAATRTAYHAHPSDPELAHYMLTAYEKKVELLLELAS